MSKNKRKRGNGGTYNIVPSIVEKAVKEIPNNTRQLEEFDGYNDYIMPPYEPSQLLQVVEESDILKPLINAAASNVALFNYGIRYRVDFDEHKASAAEKSEAEAEYDKLNILYKYFNTSSTFGRLLYKVIHDKESIGYGIIEIIRNGAGEVCGGEYARACNFRIVPQKAKDRFADVKQLRENSKGIVEEVMMPRVFKKFVQIINGNKVYFKEFGDPRCMDCKTGEYVKITENVATEVMFISNHCSYSDYGVPKWTGNIPNLMGNRKSEELNLAFFIQGKMMPFAITVSGGQLTEDSIEALKKGNGLDNAFKALLLEAVPDESTSNIQTKDDKQRVAINIEHLTDTTLSDGLFMEYQKCNREKVRGAFRLPPIYLGDSTDYNRATAEVAKLIAEEQIFIPERDEIADMFNAVINNELGIKYCEMYLKGPKMGDITEVANALAPFIAAGTVTPNMLLDALSELLGKEVEAALPDEIGNVPIEILKLQMQLQEPDRPLEEANAQFVEKSYTVNAFDSMIAILKSYLGNNDE